MPLNPAIELQCQSNLLISIGYLPLHPVHQLLRVLVKLSINLPKTVWGELALSVYF